MNGRRLGFNCEGEDVIDPSLLNTINVTVKEIHPLKKRKRFVSQYRTMFNDDVPIGPIKCKKEKPFNKMRIDECRTSMPPIKENFIKLENWLYEIHDFIPTNRMPEGYDDWFTKEMENRQKQFCSEVRKITDKLSPDELEILKNSIIEEYEQHEPVGE